VSANVRLRVCSRRRFRQITSVVNVETWLLNGVLVAVARVWSWNDLPAGVIASSSLLLLETSLFSRSFHSSTWLTCVTLSFLSADEVLYSTLTLRHMDWSCHGRNSKLDNVERLSCELHSHFQHSSSVIKDACNVAVLIWCQMSLFVKHYSFSHYMCAVNNVCFICDEL